MKVIYSDIHLQHAPEFEIFEEEKIPHAEKPARIETIVNTLRKKDFTIIAPTSFEQTHINEVHNTYFVEFIKEKSEKMQKEQKTLYPSYYIIDTYTPILGGTYPASKAAVDVALTGAQLIASGEKTVYSLCRPPGHHAEHAKLGGYCYFNNAAIAANYLSKKGKVAILDIDFHHGNGTQDIFYERDDVLYVSIHADPKVKFPYSTGFSEEVGVGKGKGYNKNYPLPLGITDEQYGAILKKALGDISAFTPDYLVISLGFDTYEKDPISGFLLTIPFYQEIGKAIQGVGVPTLVVQEGGYAIDALGSMADSFLQGLTS